MRNFIILSCFLFSFSGVVSARPPGNLTITYDLQTTILHVSAKHPTDRQSRHYLRTINIFKNDVLSRTVGFVRQQMPSGIEEDIHIEAQDGEKISIEVLCSQGGSAKAETVVVTKAPVVNKEEINK